MKKQRHLRMIIVCSSLLAMVGCSSNKAKFDFANDKTMKDIYEEKFLQYKGLRREDVARDIHDDEGDLNADVRNTVQQEKNLFDYLPNPTMVMYIYPHLTDAGTPVPGYTTFFKFYEKDNVGLPWELNRKSIKDKNQE